MQNQPLLYGFVGLLGGIVVTMLTTQNAVNTGNSGMMRMMGMRPQTELGCPMEEAKNDEMMGMGSSMNEMMGSLEDKTGDEFDSAFIQSMIVHHQGAIEMAQEAQTSALHQEIKDLARDIIVAQTKEIDQMRQWQTAWEY